MALRLKTVEYCFDTRTATLATNTTLATSTRYDSTVMTLSIPENSSRTFRSVMMTVNWRDSFTVATNVSSWRMGVKLGAAAVTDTDYAPTAQANTGDHEHSMFIHDVTSYFVSNFGSGTSQTCQLSFVMSTAAASNINNISIKLAITYEYDDSAQSTLVKTVRIPIQSHHALLTASAQEIGTITGTNNAPANQIPALDTFLPESNKSYKQIWFEFEANDGGAATTSFNAIYQIDSGGTATRATLQQALNTGTYVYDYWLIHYIDSAGAAQDPYSMTTNAAHAFKAYSSLASRFDAFGGVMYVTYTYDASSSTIMNSVILPLDTNPGYVGSTAVADSNVPTREFWIEEPGTITLVQSGVKMWMQAPGGATYRFLAGNQSERSYTLTALVNSGGHCLVHRVDHNSGLSLARGKNTLTLKMYTTTQAVVNTFVGYAIINYTSDKATAGEGVHNHSTCWFLAAPITTGAVATMREIATAAQRTPNIPETSYKLNGVGYELVTRFGTAIDGISLHAEKLSGEFSADGWQNLDANVFQNDGELATYNQITAALDSFDEDSYHTGKLDIETARKYRVHMSTAGNSMLFMWITYHAITYTVAGTITGYTGDGSGIVVSVHRTDTGELVGSATSSVGGGFSTSIFDNTINVFTQTTQDSTHMGRSDNAAAT